jgi:transaldolase
MLNVGLELSGIDERVSVKIPITPEGIRSASQLIKQGIRVTLTALHASDQALIAAALGSAYAAPYLGRMNDGGLQGLQEIIRMERILENLDSSTRLLVASIRQIDDLVSLAENGLNTFTLLPSLIEDFLENDLTSLAAKSFQDAVDQGSQA